MSDERQTDEMVEVDANAPTEPPPKPPRGFGRLPLEQRRELSRRGGKAVQACGSGHRWTSETGRAAGRKGRKGRPQEGNA
ncbi:MAG TPA: hypothetical protein VM925_21755 [Labilithrix sp.]|jgi:hypothetical protein|nr:hypothetical protein [Labilithrix sp.]